MAHPASPAWPLGRLARRSGFTLIELLVVILIIGVLVAVAAPSFLGQTEKAHDSAARQYLTIAYRAAAAISTDHEGDFTASGFDVSDLAAAIQASEPELTVVAGDCPSGATTDQRHIVVDQTDTHGGDLTLCNDPNHTVWTLKVVDHQLQPLEATVVDGAGAPLVISPSPLTSPLVSGTAQVGQTLTASTGTWANSPTGYSYQWQVSANGSSWSPATGAGAATSSYTVAAADLGDFLRVSVQASNSAGSATAASQATSAVLPLQPANQSAPQLTDADNALTHAQVSDHLSVSTGSWSDCASCAYSYTWQRADDASFTQNLQNVGSDSSSYTIGAADLSGYLRVVVQATNSGGAASAFSDSQAGPVLPATPVNQSAPSISDADNTLTHAQVGDHLSTSDGTWSNSPTGFSYTWQRADDASFTQNLQNIGTDSSSYVIQAADQGGFVRVVVQAANDGGQASAFSDNQTDAVLPKTPVDQTPPQISDADNSVLHIQVGDHLSTSDGVWSNSPTGYSYQWQRSSDGGSWSDIATATAATYTVQAADQGEYLRVSVQATNAGGSAAAASAATVAILTANPVASVQPHITDADNALTHAQVGDHLSTSDGNWSNSPTGYSYTWQRADDASFSQNLTTVGGDASTYTIQASDLGKYLRVSVEATNAGGQGSALSDNASAAVLPANPTNTAAPTFTGTVQVGQQLTATTGNWTNTPTGYSYQWQVSPTGSAWSNATGAGATSSQYTVAAVDQGQYVKVCVQATNAGGSGSACSDPSSQAATPATPVNSVAPAISDADQAGGAVTHVQVADHLSVTSGTWSDCASCAYAYTWQRADNASFTQNLANIAGATSATYTTTAADQGEYLRVTVQAQNSGGAASAFSNASGAVLPKTPVNQIQPLITDATNSLAAARIGDALSTGTGSWSDCAACSYSYQWQRSPDGSTWSSIAGATSSAYTVQAADDGYYLTVVVQAQNTGGSASSFASNQTSQIHAAPVNTAVPVLSGAATEGQTLSTSTGSFSGSSLSYAYQWQRVNDYAAAAKAPGSLVAYWRLGESSGTSATDASGNGNTGTYAGGVTYGVAGAPSGDANSAVTFNGSTGIMRSTVGWSAGYASGYTIAAWVKESSAPAGQQWIAGFSGGTQLVIQASTGKASFAAYNGSSFPGVSSTSSVTNGAWHYVVGTWDGTTQRIYVDGALQTVNDPGTTPVDQGLKFSVGAADGGSISQVTTASLDEVSFYSKSLTPSDVANQYRAATTSKGATTIAGATSSSYTVQAADVGFTLQAQVTAQNSGGSASATSAASSQVSAAAAPSNSAVPTISGSLSVGGTLTATSGTWSGTGNGYNYRWQRCQSRFAAIKDSGPTAWWRFDGNGLTDVSGNGANLQASNGANGGYSGSSPDNCPASGGVDAAWLFPGNTYVPGPANGTAAIEPASVTVESWFYVTAWGSENLIMSPNWSGTDHGYQLLINGTGSIIWAVGNGCTSAQGSCPNGTGVRTNISGSIPNLNSFYHVVGTFDASTGVSRLYINGSLAGSASGASMDYNFNGSCNLLIGGISSTCVNSGTASSSFSGVLDEMVVYNRALPASEVLMHYQSTNANWTNIQSGELPTYILGGFERNGPVRVQVTGVNSAGAGTAASSAQTSNVP